MTDDVKHLFICLVAILISPCIVFVQVFCPFPNGLFSYCWSLKKSIYILDARPFSDMKFANNFSHYVACLYLPKSSFCRVKIFNLDEVLNLLIFFFLLVSYKNCLTLGHEDFLYDSL